MSTNTDTITDPTSNASNLALLLAQSREQYLQSTAGSIDKLVTGTAVFNSSTKPKILIVKRAPHEDYLPNSWEIPGGKVDEGETIATGVARELLEETGLVLTKVVAQMPGMRYTTSKSVVEEASGEEIAIVKHSVQLNFAVEVALGEIKLDANEHVEWMWAGVGEVGEVEMTGLMRECLLRILAVE